MKRLNYNPDDLIAVRTAANRLGYDIVTLAQAQELWEAISDDWCASWLIINQFDCAETAAKIEEFLSNHPDWKPSCPNP
jgi:hypothetical protein